MRSGVIKSSNKAKKINTDDSNKWSASVIFWIISVLRSVVSHVLVFLTVIEGFNELIDYLDDTMPSGLFIDTTRI